MQSITQTLQLFPAVYGILPNTDDFRALGATYYGTAPIGPGNQPGNGMMQPPIPNTPQPPKGHWYDG